MIDTAIIATDIIKQFNSKFLIMSVHVKKILKNGLIFLPLLMICILIQQSTVAQALKLNLNIRQEGTKTSNQ